MNTVLYIGLVFGIFYFMILTIFATAFLLQKHKQNECKNIDFEGIVSVIIPYKNEAEHLWSVTESLINQSLDKSKYELIFVNDNSTDNGKQILEQYFGHIRNVKLIDNQYKTGKKFAIRTGIEHAAGTLIVTTDADSISNAERLAEVLEFYRKYRPKMIILPVFMSGRNRFEKMQALDFLSLTASGYGAAALGRPILCNGANLAFEKSVFWEFQKQYRYDIPSGDDVFLLHAVKKKYRKQIKFLNSKTASVTCAAEPTLTKLIAQRTRWSAKSKHFIDFDTLITAFIVLIINAYIPILISLSVWMLNAKLLLPLVFKLFADALFLFIFAKRYQQTDLLKVLIPTWFVSPIFNLYIALRGMFKP